MSHSEFHKGKIRILARTTKQTKEYIQSHNLQNVIIETSKDEYNPQFDVADDKYVILHKNGIYYGPECQIMLGEYIFHIEGDGGPEYIDVEKISADEYKFILMFYNGGTCIEEILETEISKLENKPITETPVMLNAKELHTIMDSINCVLDRVPYTISYINNKYTREELENLSKKIQILIIKNNW